MEVRGHYKKINKKRLRAGKPRRGSGRELAGEKGQIIWLSIDNCLCSSNIQPYALSFHLNCPVYTLLLSTAQDMHKPP